MQSNTDWHYVKNQFGNELLSYGSTLIFIDDHSSKLKNGQADPNVAPILANTLVVQTDYHTAYSKWEKASAFWKGATNKVDSLLLELVQKQVPRWDAMVQTFFLEGTEEYITLFPNGRTGFREGGKDVQIQSVRTFLDSTTEYPDLANLGAIVTTFLTQLEQARNRQQQREQAVRDAATDLRAAQAEVHHILYSNLGWLMHRFSRTPEVILNYYNVELVRNTGQRKKQEDVADVQADDDVADDM